MGRAVHEAPTSARHNVLALASVPLALVFPVGILCELVSSRVDIPIVAAIPLSSHIGSALALVSPLAEALAIVAGHVALRRADRQPFRGIARLGMALGYGSFLGLAGLALWVTVHGINVRYVF